LKRKKNSKIKILLLRALDIGLKKENVPDYSIIGGAKGGSPTELDYPHECTLGKCEASPNVY
jgi:hypothetical protein